MRSRIGKAAAAVLATSLLLAAAVPAASGKQSKSGRKSSAFVTVRCAMHISTQPPAGSATVDQPPQQGSQYGPVHCARKGFGGGVTADTFTVDGSGDTVGHYTQYLGTGTISGSFDLTPAEGQLSSTTFSSQSWSGTITVTGGTGAFRKITGRRGSGTLACTSPDSVHLRCVEHVAVALPSGGTPAG